MITLSSTLSEKYKKPKVIGSSEPRRSQRVRNEKYLDTYFISIHSIVILVEGDRNIVLKRTPIILNMKYNLKTFYEAMSLGMLLFEKKRQMMKWIQYCLTILWS